MKTYDDYFTPRFGDFYIQYYRPHIKCLNEDEIFVRSDESNVVNTANIQIGFVGCTGKPECKSPEEIEEYWKTNTTFVNILYESQFIDMKNFTDPIQ